MILLIGYRTEKTFRRFVEYVASQTNDFEVLDFSRIKTDEHLCIRQSPRELFIELGEQKLWFSHYTGFYTRGYSTDFNDIHKNLAVAKLVAGISSYLEFCGQSVVNRPSAGASNYNKFVHLHDLKRYGFNVPYTIISGDVEIAGKTVDNSGNWVSKSCSGIRTRVEVVDETHLSALKNISLCPTTFQKRIKGADVRIHVVGDQFYPERIVSYRTDYRYNDPDLPDNVYSDCDIPQNIKDACLAYCKDQKQLFAGIDFKISDDDGLWYILEANPMPGYECYDRRQNSRISKGLYELLRSPQPVPFVSDERRTKLSPF